MHHWHSQSYFAASWNATSSPLVPMWAGAVTKPNHHQHLQARAQSDPTCQYTEQVKIETSYKKVAALRKDLKMSLHWYILGPNYSQHSHRYQHTAYCSGKCGKRVCFGVKKSVSHEETKMEVLPSPITNQSGHVSCWWVMAVLQSDFLFSQRWGRNNLN